MKKVLCAIALLFSANVNATLIDHGDYVQDTASGLEWLKLDATIGLSSTQVIDEFGAGGAFEGWQYATGVQWEHLLFGQGFGAATNCDAGNFCGQVMTDSGDTADALMQLIGYVPDSGSYYPYHNSLGMLADIDADSGKHWITQLFTDDLFIGPYPVNTAWATTFATTEDEWLHEGSWLVRSTQVPEPSALSLFVLGLAGLWSVRRKVRR